METVLLYQIKGTKTAVLLKPVLLKLGIRVRIVEPEQYLQSIGFLAGNKAFAESPEAYDGAGFDEPMMVMAGFSERKLDLFLTEMRRKKVPPIALKAIVTTQNQAWNSLQLYRELKEEHEKMKSYGKDNIKCERKRKPPDALFFYLKSTEREVRTCETTDI